MSKKVFEEKDKSMLKGLSKFIYVIATIGKVCIYIAIPFLILTMIILPIIFNNTKVVNNNIVFTYRDDTVEMNDIGNNKIEIRHNGKIIDEDDHEDYKVFKKYRNTLNKYSKKELIGYTEAGLILLISYLYLIILVLKHLAKLFKNIKDEGTPFTLDNVDHMTKMGKYMIAVILLPIIASILYSVFADIDINFDFGIISVMEILFVLAMSMIFKYGYSVENSSKNKSKDE